MKRRVLIFHGIGVKHFFSQITLVEFRNYLIIEYLIRKRLEFEMSGSSLRQKFKSVLGITDGENRVPSGENDGVGDLLVITQNSPQEPGTTTLSDNENVNAKRVLDLNDEGTGNEQTDNKEEKGGNDDEKENDDDKNKNKIGASEKSNSDDKGDNKQ